MVITLELGTNILVDVGVIILCQSQCLLSSPKIFLATLSTAMSVSSLSSGITCSKFAALDLTASIVAIPGEERVIKSPFKVIYQLFYQLSARKTGSTCIFVFLKYGN